MTQSLLTDFLGVRDSMASLKLSTMSQHSFIHSLARMREPAWLDSWTCFRNVSMVTGMISFSPGMSIRRKFPYLIEKVCSKEMS